MQTGLGRIGQIDGNWMPDWNWNPPAIFQAAMKGLGAIALQLTTDKRNYVVGDTPTYTLQAAVPGSRVAWTSFKDGKHTGEFQADYGQTVDINGTAELVAGGPWMEDDVGQWQKQVLVIAPDGATSVAQVFFTVGPVASTPSTPSTSSGGFLDGSFDIAGFDVPKPAAYVGGALGLWLLFGKRR